MSSDARPHLDAAGARPLTPFRTAEILAVGSELLTSFRIDSNSLYLTSQLNALGVDVRAKAVIADVLEELTAAFAAALARVDLVVSTGGLGPTADDLTREAASAALGLTLAEDPAIVEWLRERFRKRSAAAMPSNNLRQAMVPAGAEVMSNPRGSAPGLWIAYGDKAVALLPGPPREMEPMFEESVRPRLAARSAGRRVVRRVIKIAGQPESSVDATAQPIYGPLAAGTPPIETTILASPGQVELHLSARGDEVASMEAALDAAVERLTAAVGDAVVSTDGRAIEAALGDALIERGLTIAFAESCTGGLVAARMTERPGSSAYVRGGVVAYSNDVKASALGVDAALIGSHGAVSEPVAAAMADGARRRLGADVAVAVTGIAGPDGGSPEKPVGTVWFAVSGPGDRRETLKRVVPGDRHVVRGWAVMVALDMARRALR